MDTKLINLDSPVSKTSENGLDRPEDLLEMEKNLKNQPHGSISVTHFSTMLNGHGVEKETIFTDTRTPANPFTNPFLNDDHVTTTADKGDSPNPFKYNTIGRSNPFTKNPFLDSDKSKMETQTNGNKSDAKGDDNEENQSQHLPLNKIVSVIKLRAVSYLLLTKLYDNLIFVSRERALLRQTILTHFLCHFSLQPEPSKLTQPVLLSLITSPPSSLHCYF